MDFFSLGLLSVSRAYLDLISIIYPDPFRHPDFALVRDEFEHSTMRNLAHFLARNFECHRIVGSQVVCKKKNSSAQNIIPFLELDYARLFFSKRKKSTGS